LSKTATVAPATPDVDTTDNTGSATTQVVQPIGGGTGGTAEQPTPAPGPVAKPVAGGTDRPSVLPFTGSYTLGLLQGGVALLVEALRRCLAAADTIGVRVVLVDALDDRAKSFYTGYGFEASPIDPHHLMLLMKDVCQTLGG
jgi:hypothetical protein